MFLCHYVYMYIFHLKVFKVLSWEKVFNNLKTIIYICKYINPSMILLFINEINDYILPFRFIFILLNVLKLGVY